MASTRHKKGHSMLKLPSLRKKTEKTGNDNEPLEQSLQQCHILSPQICKEALENMFVDFSKSLWHAFNSLARDGLVQKSRLKVIVSSTGRELGFEKAEEILNNSEENKLDFLSFFAIIQSEILNKLKASSEDNQLLSSPNFEQAHKVCWMLCANKHMCQKYSEFQPEIDYITESEKPDVDKDTCSCKSADLYDCHMLDDDAYKVWRVFNFFVECDVTGNPLIPLHLDTEEAEYICKVLIASSGQLNKEKDSICFRDLTQKITFSVFLQLFETIFACDLSPTAQTYVVGDLYDTVILDTLKKGSLSKHGYKMKNWKEYYFVLTSRELKYYATVGEDELKKCVHFDDSWKIEVPLEDVGPKPHRFILHTAIKLFELSAPTIKEKYEWISVLQKVIEHNARHTEDEVSIQKQMMTERKDKREVIRNEMQIPAQRYLEETTKLENRLQSLEEEKLAHAIVEAKLMEEAALRLFEHARCLGLEAEMAKNSGEEMKKRQELQELCDEQRRMYDEERFRRMLLANERDEGARLLSEAKEKIELLESEKNSALDKHKETAMRLQTTEDILAKIKEALT